MIKYTFIVFFVFAASMSLFANNCYNNNKSISQDDSTKYQEAYLTTLRGMAPSLSGSTPKGNKYNLFALKKIKGWNLIILDSSSYYSFKQDKLSKKQKKNGEEGEIIENSQTYTEMLCLMSKAKLLKKINKPKNVSGLTFTCYYKFKPQAKKMYRSYLRIQSKAKFFDSNLKNGAMGKKKILNDLIK
jgi:hypothetical protein